MKALITAVITAGLRTSTTRRRGRRAEGDQRPLLGQLRSADRSARRRPAAGLRLGRRPCAWRPGDDHRHQGEHARDHRRGRRPRRVVLGHRIEREGRGHDHHRRGRRDGGRARRRASGFAWGSTPPEPSSMPISTPTPSAAPVAASGRARTCSLTYWAASSRLSPAHVGVDAATGRAAGSGLPARPPRCAWTASAIAFWASAVTLATAISAASPRLRSWRWQPWRAFASPERAPPRGLGSSGAK